MKVGQADARARAYTSCTRFHAEVRWNRRCDRLYRTGHAMGLCSVWAGWRLFNVPHRLNVHMRGRCFPSICRNSRDDWGRNPFKSRECLDAACDGAPNSSFFVNDPPLDLNRSSRFQASPSTYEEREKDILL